MSNRILPLGYFFRQERARLRLLLEEEHCGELKNDSFCQRLRIRKRIAKMVEQRLKEKYPEEAQRCRKGNAAFVACD